MVSAQHSVQLTETLPDPESEDEVPAIRVEVDGDELLGFERRREKRRPAAAEDADLEDPTAVELVHVAYVSLDEPAWLLSDALVVSGGLVRLG